MWIKGKNENKRVDIVTGKTVTVKRRGNEIIVNSDYYTEDEEYRNYIDKQLNEMFKGFNAVFGNKKN